MLTTFNYSGGNDVQLLNILNQCIFQWAVLQSNQVELAKAIAIKEGWDWAVDYNWNTLGLGCQKQLEISAEIIESNTFAESLDDVLSAAKTKLAKE